MPYSRFNSQLSDEYILKILQKLIVANKETGTVKISRGKVMFHISIIDKCKSDSENDYFFAEELGVYFKIVSERYEPEILQDFELKVYLKDNLG